MVHLVLVEPEIPQNTGNIARTCVLTGTTLHLVEPLGFSLEQREVRRAGLDYWSDLKLAVYPHFAALRQRFPEGRFIFFSTASRVCYTDLNYRSGDYLVFGSETRGLPPGLVVPGEPVARIPLHPSRPRSLNLSNAAAIVLYEALRQQGFPGLI